METESAVKNNSQVENELISLEKHSADLYEEIAFLEKALVKVLRSGGLNQKDPKESSPPEDRVPLAVRIGKINSSFLGAQMKLESIRLRIEV